MFEVEEIIDKRVNRNTRTFSFYVGRNEYKVKWVNYSYRHNSWVPEDNFNYPQLV